ncbi:glutamate carboxypeptidase [Laccaria bicolor S238N-H82]|uniref:Glutamate carboxypeptidase n=1 Tax=Laccaria bicolor (strain S238N-H82 / ATCC MYA-4686) TaxID=486041 RepID=B0D4S6_LACBS|nr:glutamate carboxypeptidase [Laccaria bicolor S238N-H82]EDR10617.1 glutamate carboxypeptidase [Laccaria bicolor S238N-H82]|eukprot:XP_001879067.1 glutamate carboxypeptidase [Laccaria bicolor S238N-H82]
MPAPQEFLSFVDTNANAFIKRLAEAVAIPSISGDATHRADVVKMGEWLNTHLKAVGVSTQLVDLGKHTMDGEELNLPPAILGRIGDDKSKKTVLIYGHFDVQPANKSDGWNTDPFTLTIDESTGQLIGRGSSDDKGPVLGWLNVLQYHHQQRKALPVNLRFCFEGMEESGSEGLDDLVERESKPGGWFDGVDCVCISDNYWLNTRTPVLTYGLRGLTYLKVTVHGPGRDLHSGVFGRTVYEPMTDLIAIMSKLVDSQGNILIPGVDEMVCAADEEEREIYESLDYSYKDIESAAGGPVALTTDKVDLLMGRMRYPSLSLHGIEGAFSGVGAKTVIPAKVSGKFSIRLVPPQTPEIVDPLVISYIESEFAKLNTKNTLTIENLHGGKPWVADHTHWNFEAAKRATKAVYGQDPDLTREGGSIPVTLTFAESLKVNVLLLPMGRGDDGAHSTNEKLDRSNFIEGTKLLGTYLYELADIQGKK